MKTLLTEWECGTRQGIPTKKPKGFVNRQRFTLESQKKIGYKTNYKNHNWPKRKQSLQLEEKEKYYKR